MSAPSDAVRVGEIDGMWAFLKQIDWTEPWLIILNVFHIVCLLFTFCTAKYFNVQVVYFLLLLLLIYMSENINEWASQNYKLFARLQYFDSSGLFISVVLCVPVLINCLVILCLWIYTAAHMLVSVKRAQLRQQIKKDKQESENKDK
ncbi:transmembrane protein 18-like [Amphiura filiformis]|uniref:transmembrane protein 18-like n=1 Tax=Amphiura filiformis TaxID=82378 RepID=UPI003B219ACA